MSSQLALWWRSYREWWRDRPEETTATLFSNRCQILSSVTAKIRSWNVIF